MEKLIKINDILGASFDSPKYAEKDNSEIKNHDLIVIDGIMQEYEYFDPNKIIESIAVKIKKPIWKN